MFERFDVHARQAIVLAHEEARILNHNYVGTEHILLGMLHIYMDGEIAFRALNSLGINQEIVRRGTEEIVGLGQAGSKVGHIPFTPRAKEVLEKSLREALFLDHKQIGTEHILLSLIREGEGVAAQILGKEVDGGLTEMRNAVISQLSRSRAKPPEPELPETKDPNSVTIHVDPKTREFLERLSENAGGGELALLDIIKAYFADGGPLDELQQRGGESIED